MTPPVTLRAASGSVSSRVSTIVPPQQQNIAIISIISAILLYAAYSPAPQHVLNGHTIHTGTIHILASRWSPVRQRMSIIERRNFQALPSSVMNSETQQQFVEQFVPVSQYHLISPSIE